MRMIEAKRWIFTDLGPPSRSRGGGEGGDAESSPPSPRQGGLEQKQNLGPLGVGNTRRGARPKA